MLEFLQKFKSLSDKNLLKATLTEIVAERINQKQQPANFQHSWDQKLDFL